jgi:hypothetical protein
MVAFDASVFSCDVAKPQFVREQKNVTDLILVRRPVP